MRTAIKEGRRIAPAQMGRSDVDGALRKRLGGPVVAACMGKSTEVVLKRREILRILIRVHRDDRHCPPV